MPRSLLFSFLFFLILTNAHPQLHVGYYHDLDGFPIHDYVDPFEYTPDTKLYLRHYSESFEKGKVYSEDGSIAEGFIRFKNKKIWFKEKRTSSATKLLPDEVQALTIGVDSFFVASDFYVEKGLGPARQSDPQFMQYLTSFNGLVFARHYFYTSAMAQSASASPVIKTYLVKGLNETKWTNFSGKKQEFKELALKHFGHIPYLEQKIKDGSLGPGDAHALIKTAEYYSHFRSEKLIHFDRFWNKLQDSSNSIYQVKIQSLEKDSIWTFDYFKEGAPIYRVRYSSLFPHERHGDFEIFGKKGFPMQVVTYDDNAKKSTMQAFEDGTIHYKTRRVEAGVVPQTYTTTRYLAVNDATGNSLLQSGEVMERVSFRQGSFFNTYRNGKLVESYRMEGDTKIHQVLDREYNFKRNRLQTLIGNHFDAAKFTEEAYLNAQGLYFITVIISDKGLIVDAQVHNTLTSELDNKVKVWVNKYLGDGPYSIKFKPYRVGKEKVYAEFLIPLQFAISKFYRKPSNYDWNWHNQMMFQQQMMQPVNLPAPPVRF